MSHSCLPPISRKGCNQNASLRQTVACARILALAIVLVSTVHTSAGITYQVRSVTTKGVSLTFTVWASGDSYRTEMEPSEDAPEISRQYPIVISNDGGHTERAIRPWNRTWYERSNDISRSRSMPAIGTNARIVQPSITFVEEASDEQFAKLRTRKFVLKVSYIVESEIDTEKVRLHKTRTVLFWVAELACAPRSTVRLSFGAPEIDEAVERKTNSIAGLIVRTLDSETERYEGGAIRTLQSTAEVIHPRCSEIEPSLFAIPKGYSYQEPVIGAPGASIRSRPEQRLVLSR